jgi:YVTN family beta-propeller protein
VINSANQVEKQIPIEHSSNMAFNPLQNSTYVTQPPLDRVQIIDSSDNLTDTISINNPYAIDFNPSNNYMYVTELENNFVSVIDTNNQVKDRILVGKGPTSIEFNPINNNMYVSHRSSDTVSIIDSKTNELVTSIIPEPGATGSDIEFNPRDNNMYVSTNTGIYIIDSNSNDVIGKYRDGADALSMAFNPLDGKMYYTQPYQFPPHIGSLSASIHLPTAVCPIEYLQHWEIISFTIKSKEVAQILEIPFNQEKGSTNTLDIIFQRPNDYIPTEFISLEQTVLNHLRNEVKLPSSLQNIIEIVDVEYTTICAEDFYSNNIIENKFDESQNRNNTNVTTIKKLS